MKPFVILGAIAGFAVGGGCSLLNDCPESTAWWRACAAALLMAVLVRWWGGMWMQNLADAVNQRRHQPAHEVKSTLKPVQKL